MKSVRLVVAVLVLGLVAMSCQSLAPGGDQANTNTGSVENAASPVEYPSVPYPSNEKPAAPSNGYPAPEAEMRAALSYPQLSDGAHLEWENVAGMLFSGQIESVAQAHDLQVTLKLKDGRTLLTTEPAIDDVINLIKQCGDPCKEIRIATE